MGTTRIPKDYRPIVAEALAAGWTLDPSGKHLKLVAPDGYSTPLPSAMHSTGLLKAITKRVRNHDLEHPCAVCGRMVAAGEVHSGDDGEDYCVSCCPVCAETLGRVGEP